MQEEMRIELIDGHEWYVGPDGWKHPVVAGGEGEVTAPPAGSNPAESGLPASNPAESPVGGSNPAESTATPAEAAKVYDEEYVRSLRDENARYRTRAKTYEDAFEGYDDASKATLLDIARQLADPSTQPAAARRLQEIASRVIENAEKGTPGRPDGEEDPDQRPMTRAEWKAEQARLQEENAQAEAIRQIESQATELGAPPGSPDYALLLLFAQEPDVAGDLVKAKERVDTYIADKARARAEAHAAKGEKWPIVTQAAGVDGGSGPGDPEGGKPKNWKEARAGALAFLNARAGNVS